MSASNSTPSASLPEQGAARAYDLVFGIGRRDVGYHPDRQADAERPGSEPDGWIGSEGPAIPVAQWPRSTNTGLPMLHVITLRLPEEYRRQGADLPGIALFAGEGQFADPDEAPEGDPDSRDPFLADLGSAKPHPRLQLLEDEIGGEFAAIPLTAAELAGRQDPPRDRRKRRQHRDESEGHNAWDLKRAPAPVWLVERDDPNAGLVPRDSWDIEPPYQDPLDGDQWRPWAAHLFGRMHLGGTAFAAQSLPDDLTPYYLELEEFEPVNFGGGTAQYDLDSGVFDWQS